MRKGAEIVLQCLRAEGVDLVFGYPGGAIMPLYDALDGSGVRHILTRHEQGAVFAAEGYARSTGKVGVAIATSGPGATNLVTGIAEFKTRITLSPTRPVRVNERIVGAASLIIKFSLVATTPPAVITRIGPVTAPAGTIVVKMPPTLS